MADYHKNYIKQLRNQIQNSGQVNIVLGSGDVWYGKDWITTNIEELDVVSEEDWAFLFGKDKADNIFCEHVWEHLTLDQAHEANKNVRKYLSTAGNFRLAIPDGNFPNADYINHVKVGGIGAGADDHKVLYDYQLLLEKLDKIPFRVELLEYWDEKGKFHFTDWDVSKGMVGRSRRFDERNADGVLRYTSLIVDCKK